MSRKVYFLREEPFEGYNWNVGDQLIHAGVVALMERHGPLTSIFINRKRFSIPPPEADADAVVYAGMPQFAATDRATMDDQAWSMLRHRFPLVPAINIGCGTGYALHVNRLAIAANMASRAYNKWFYESEREVVYLPRDPASFHFLSLLGLDATLSLCPSHYAPAPRRAAGHEVGIALAHPDIKFDESQKKRLAFNLGDLYREIVAAFPNALVICQEPADVEWAREIGLTNIVLPTDVDAFFLACGSLRMLVSTRVHATVCASLQNIPTLHLAIDGRSDLLTPLMAVGLQKLNIFWHTKEQIVGTAQDIAEGVPIDNVTQRFGAVTAVSIERALNGQARPSTRGAIIVNPEMVAHLRADDTVLFLADQFRHNAGERRDEQILLSAVGIGKHAIFGPYKKLPRGRYCVAFDLEYWGRASANVEATFDAAVSGDVMTGVRHGLSSLLTSSRLPVLEFDHTRTDEDVEFRVEVFGNAPDLQIAFYGVVIRAIGRSSRA
jgi:hypothetical protein